MEKLSVIINTYNDTANLNGIKNNYNYFCKLDVVQRVLIVSDGSQSDFNELLQRHFPSESLVLLPENVGLHMARMSAVEYLEGGYCLFLDSDDDIVTLNRFNGSGIYNFVGFQAATGAVTIELGVRDIEKSNSRQIIAGDVSGVVWNKIFRVSDLLTVPKIELRNGEDYFTCLWLRDEIDKMEHVDEVLVQYNILTNSLSKRPTRYKYHHLWKSIILLFKADKISVQESITLVWYLIIKNFLRSIRHNKSYFQEVLSFFLLSRVR